MSNEFDIAPDLGTQLFPEETAEEAVARIVAQNPQKHGVTVQERMARARDAVTRMLAAGADLSNLSAEDALIVSVGGDPNEMMVGNKPRWTVDGDRIKDHLEEKEYGAIPILSAEQVNAGFEEKDPAKRLEQAVARTSELMAIHAEAVTTANQLCCAHSWPIQISPEAQCEKCGLTWRAFCGPSRLDPTQPAMTEGFEKAIDDIQLRVAIGYKAQQVVVDIDSNFVNVDLTVMCAHSWPEDPDEETRCPLCQMTFADWVNS